ncbi:MAG: adenylyl-sulfate kinase [Propionicimonas sp.]
MTDLEQLLDEPRLQAADAVVADLRLLLQGVVLPWRELGGFLDRLDLATPPDLVRLRIPSTMAESVRSCGRLVITNRESSPIGRIADATVETGQHETWVQGRPEPGSSRPTQSEEASGAASSTGLNLDRLVVVCQRPFLTAEVATLRTQVADGRGVLIVIPEAPTPDNLPHNVLRRCILSDVPGLHTTSLPITWREHDSDLALARAVATANSATRLQVLSSDEPAWRQLVADLDRLGDSLARDRVSTGTWAQLTRWRPPRSRRGLVVFFTGLSGSGKSTLARALVDRLGTISDRSLTLLDGDEVRRLLSSGLGFDRASRDLNIQRIGFVASEIARSGGIAVCAPIAPYASSRAGVRARVAPVGDLVLVHVATPLEECERRDVKGLYAQARAGLITEFTGVSDPYETPTDADLTIDTANGTPEEAVALVLDYLRRGGWLSATMAEEQAWTG